ncbi:MAG: hypothetical protein JOZ18_00555 [Chloroflexi bacterium]|nr:hypothetical protein [Chloroflexota bacterium]
MDRSMLAALIMMGASLVLLAACIYLARSQKTHPSRRSASWLDPLCSKGIGPVLDATEQLDKKLSAPQQRPRRRKRKRKV